MNRSIGQSLISRGLFDPCRSDFLRRESASVCCVAPSFSSDHPDRPLRALILRMMVADVVLHDDLALVRHGRPGESSVHPTAYLSCMRRRVLEGEVRVSERTVGGHNLREVPFPGRKTKFMITDDEAWFLAFEDDASVPPLVEILVRVLDIDLADEGVVSEVDAKLEDGRILLGYVSEDGKDVSVRSLPERHDLPVRKRLTEVFGTKIGEAVKMGAQTEVRG